MPTCIFCRSCRPHWDEVLERPRLLEPLPVQQAADVGDDSFGTAIASRLPVRDLDVFWSAELPQMRGVLRVDDRDVDVCQRSPAAAANAGIHALPTSWARTRSLEHRPAPRRQRSFIVAGDFNSTPDSAFADPACARSADDAWEAGGTRLRLHLAERACSRCPPMRLDHVFVSRDLGVRSARVGDGVGSDHRPVVADIARRAAFVR